MNAIRSWRALANAVFSRLVFGAHPYGRPNDGTPESIPQIAQADLVNFHRTWFVPNNAILAIVGDLQTNEAFAAAEKAFGGWAKRDVPMIKVPEPPLPARRVIVIDRPGSAQTEIRCGEQQRHQCVLPEQGQRRPHRDWKIATGHGQQLGHNEHAEKSEGSHA